jgi:hypothetical protein
MRTLSAVGAALLALAGARAPAQQPASPYEAVVKEMIAATDGLTAVLATIKDAPSAEAARPELKKAAAAFLEVRKRAEGLPQPSQEERDRIQAKYQKKLARAVDHYLEERGRVATVGGGREALQELAVLDRPPAGKKQ